MTRPDLQLERPVLLKYSSALGWQDLLNNNLVFFDDANGAVVPNAESSVSFTVSGPGRVVGVDNGNPIDTSSYKGGSRKAFSGKVLAIVQSTATPGQITVTATSSGLTMGSATAMAQ